MKRVFSYGVLLALSTGLLAATYQRFGLSSAHAAEKSPLYAAPKIILNSDALPKDTRGITSFAPVVKRVAPSVVTIRSSKTTRRSSVNSPFDDPALRRFFGAPDEEGPATPAPRGRNGRRAPQREQKEEALGSGVIISADGYIMSNNHVVEGADELKVSLNGSDEEYVAKVIGTDPHTDVSVLKIDAKNLPPITITDSDNLQVGDIVLAVGNPFGVGQTVTMGIVSATGRGVGGIVDYEDFIQTDAAINMGNSGGALVDAEGRLVGINTAILSPTGGSIGLGFAVPIDMARRVMDSIIQHGKVARGFLGLSLAPEISPGLAKKFNLKDRSGALVNDVVPDAPASQAGVKAGDVVVEFNGKKVPDQRQLRLWASQTPPDTKVSLKVLREGKEMKFNATLGELPGDDAASATGRNKPAAPPKSSALDGVEVGDLDRAIRRQLGVPQNMQGALITAVEPNSNAAQAELKKNDVILEINKQPVKNAQEAIDASEKIKDGEQILVRVWSSAGGNGGTRRYVVVEPEKATKGKKSNEEK